MACQYRYCIMGRDFVLYSFVSHATYLVDSKPHLAMGTRLQRRLCRQERACSNLSKGMGGGRALTFGARAMSDAPVLRCCLLS